MTEHSFNLLDHILNNIIQNPAEEKFKRMKKDNKSLHTKLTQFTSGQEMMAKVGFQLNETEGVYVLSSKIDVQILKGFRLDLQGGYKDFNY